MQNVKKISVHHKALISIISLLTLFLIYYPSDDAKASKTSNITVNLSQLENITFSSPKEIIKWTNITIEKGDSLSKIFKKNNLSAKELYNLTLDIEDKKLLQIKPGKTLSFYKNKDDKLQGLKYPLNRVETLVISKDENNLFSHKIETKTITSKTAFIQGKIKSSFYQSGTKAGLNAAQIMELASIFSWDVDFALDLRKGDSFSLLFEKEYAGEEFIGNGKITVAEFVNRGQRFVAIRYKDGFYYTPQGKSMRKSFLRSPVHFSYVSSNFNPRRVHPVTGKVVPHNGIDYAARVGTPVMSAGAGSVIASGYNKYNGNYLFIKHNETYLTKYLHLNRRYVKRGQKVKQGEKIGEVGATGRVTGAHLHYEFIVNGVHRNPRTVKLPSAPSLDLNNKKEFNALANNRLQELRSNQYTMFAQN